MFVDCRFHRVELLVIFIQADSWELALWQLATLGNLPSVQQLHDPPLNQPASRLFGGEITHV
jgi:hypothetical protein